MSWFAHVFTVGLLALIAPTALLLVSLRWGRAGFASDYPEDIQNAMPSFSRAERVRGAIFAAAFLITLLAAAVYVVWSWLQQDPGRGFVAAYLMAVAVVALFCAIDLVVVDWLIICWWRPDWVVIPGTEDCAGWGDYMFHVREQFSPKGIAALLLLPAVLAAVALVLRAA